MKGVKKSGPYVLGGTVLVLRQFERMCNLVPSDIVGPAIKIALGIADVVQTINDNKESCQTLLTRLGRLMVVVMKPWVQIDPKRIPKELEESLSRLMEWLDAIYARLLKLRDAKWYKHILLSKERTEKLAECMQDMNAAVNFFHVEAEIDAALSADALKNQVAGVQTTVEGVSVTVSGVAADVRRIHQVVVGDRDPNADLPLPSTLLPPPPEIMFGRDAEVSLIATRLTSANNTRYVILGPGGIGKTTVALAVAAHPLVTTKFAAGRIFWVPCAEATNPQLLEDLIARSMGLIVPASSDRRRKIRAGLSQQDGPCLLLMDNFETPWDDLGKQSEVEEILRDVASVDGVSVLLTMRGDVPPSTGLMKWTEPQLEQCSVLSLDAARQLYLEIAPKSQEEDGGETLDALLQEMSCMPLAVRLLAMRGRRGETPSELLALWKSGKKTTGMLQQAPADRLKSVDYSIELSLKSNTVQQNPHSLTLLRVLVELPGGTRHEFLETIAPEEIEDPHGALDPLLQAALVQKSEQTRLITILSPIRSMITHKFPLPEEHRAKLLGAYYALLASYSDKSTERDVVGAEKPNIETLLFKALAAKDLDLDLDLEKAIEAAFAFSVYQKATYPHEEPLEQAVRAARSLVGKQELLAKALGKLGEMYRRVNRLQDSIDTLKEALALYRSSSSEDSQMGAADSLNALCSAYSMNNQYDQALASVQEALAIYRKLKYDKPIAEGYYNLGNIYRMLGEPEKSLHASEMGLGYFRSVGDAHGMANCLTTMGQSYRVLDKHSKALEASKESLELYRTIHDDLGAAGSLYTLGMAYHAVDRFSEAVEALRESYALYKRIGESYGMANALMCEADALRSLDRFDESIEVGRESFALYQKIGVKLGMANVTRRIGATFAMKGRAHVGVALEHFGRAERIYAEIGRWRDVELCRQNARTVRSGW